MPSARRAAELDAVTIDAFGTLLMLEDPAPRLREALAAQGVGRDLESVRAAFRAEAAYYRPRSLRGRDGTNLATLRRECVGVFLDHLQAELDPAGFVPRFMDAIVFRLADGADAALDALQAAGLSLACVANWDISLHDHLRRLGLADRFEVTLTSAEAQAEKPEPGIFLLALARLGIRPDRALHIGDEDTDRAGAASAGLGFEPVPLATLPERLGL
jgi:putative hydrolase of the HAD superfamily